MEGVPFEEEWPFAIHLLAHIYVNDTYDFLSFSF
jgi:COP9 signalosome complex subunit 8